MANETPANPSNLVILPPDRTLYFNGFSMGVGTGDLVMTLMRNGTPVLTLNCSYTVGKTMAEGLTHVVTELESKLGQKIATISTVAAAVGS